VKNLIPVVRPDINGKLVTRHVRPEKPAAAALSIPPVRPRPTIVGEGSTIKAAKGRKMLLGAVTTAFSSNEAMNLRHPLTTLALKVREIPEDVAEAALDASLGISDSIEKRYLHRLVLKAIDGEVGATDIKSAIHYYRTSSTDLRDDIDYYYEIGTEGLGDYPLGNLIRAVKSYKLSGFDYNPSVSLGEQDKKAAFQCDALKELHIAAEALDSGDNDIEPRSTFHEDGTLKQTRLAQIAVDNPERVSEAIEVMQERVTLDGELIDSIVNHDVNALRQGAL
jgi:hypothetical protein